MFLYKLEPLKFPLLLQNFKIGNFRFFLTFAFDRYSIFHLLFSSQILPLFGLAVSFWLPFSPHLVLCLYLILHFRALCLLPQALRMSFFKVHVCFIHSLWWCLNRHSTNLCKRKDLVLKQKSINVVTGFQLRYKGTRFWGCLEGDSMLLHVCLEGWETGHSIGLSFVMLYGYHVHPPQYHATRRALHLCGNLPPNP